MIPLGELSVMTISYLSSKYGCSESHIIELRKQNGMTRKQRSKRKWCAERMSYMLSEYDDADIAKLYGLPVDAVKMIRELSCDI